MSAIDLLKSLKQQGIVLDVEDGKLVSKAEKGKLTPNLISAIKVHKEQLVRLLNASKNIPQGFELPALKVQSSSMSQALSYGQKGLWLLNKLQQSNRQYHMPMAFSMKGGVDAKTLEHSIKSLLRRHDVLRTVIDEVAGQPFTRVMSEENFMLAQQESNVQQVSADIDSFFANEFNLANDYMLKACLLKLSAKEQIFLVNIHHIACDGWSMDIFSDELIKLYEALVTNQVIDLPELPIQYANYAQWQEQLLSGQSKQKLLDYWSQRLAGAPQSHSLALDKTRPNVFLVQGDKVLYPLNTELKSKLDGFCQQHGFSLNHVLKATFGLLLNRLSGEQRLVIGSPVANRPLKELTGLIGFFVNTLPFQFDFEHNLTAKELINKVKSLELDDIEHQHLPFDLIVEHLAPVRDLSLSPIFQIVFAMQNYQHEARQLANIELSLIPHESVLAKYDLSLYIYNLEDKLELHFDYATSLFERETIESMCESYVCLLEEILRDPSQYCHQIELLSESQKSALAQVCQGQSPSSKFAKMNNAVNILVNANNQYPQHLALQGKDNAMSYVELISTIAAVQKELVLRGVRENDMVAIAIERSVWPFVLCQALMGMGAIFIPIDTELPQNRIDFIINDSQANWAVCDSATANKVTNVPNLLNLNELIPPQGSNEAQLLVTDRRGKAAYIIYTSGTTGQPKGVQLPHDGLFSLASYLVAEEYSTPQTRLIQFANFAFDASILEWLIAFSNGGSLFVLEPGVVKDPKQVQQFINSNQINHAMLPPSYLAYLEPEKLSQLTTLGTGGEKIELETARIWQAGRQYYNAYGPTEITVMATLAKYSERPELISIGKPLHGIEIKVVDKELKSVPIGWPGELLISGAGVAIEYLGLTKLTAEKFITLDDKQFYLSGDLVKQTANGELIYLGRNDQQVKLRGFRIELGEIEAKLSNLPGVSLACVKVFNSNGLDSLVGFCEVSDLTIDVATFRHLLKAQLPEYMLPASIHLCETLAITPSGKIDYNVLKEPINSPDNVTIPPQGATEIQMFNIWENLLAKQSFGVTDSFFDVGGYSLLLTRLLNEIEKVWQINLPIQQAFQQPTIRELAIIIDTLAPSCSGAFEKDIEMEGGFL